jgi:uncharacterized protein
MYRADSQGQGGATRCGWKLREMHNLCDSDRLEGFCRESGIDLLVLFGSHASGKAGGASDVDLAVQPARGAQPDKLQLIFDLEEVFAPRRVDLVILTALTAPLLLHEIFVKGTLLFESRPGEFRKARLRAWKLYQDTAPLRERERRSLRAFVERMKGVS